MVGHFKKSLKKSLSSPNYLSFLLCYFLGILVFCFTFMSVIHFQLISVKDVRSVSRFTFTCGCPIVSPLLKRPSLLLTLLLFLCQRSVDYIYVGLFLGSFFYYIALFVYSPTNTVFITAAL